jgi:hypothetical protein
MFVKDKLSIYGSKSLCWALATFQFINPVHSRQHTLDGVSGRRKDSTYEQTNERRKELRGL